MAVYIGSGHEWCQYNMLLLLLVISQSDQLDTLNVGEREREVFYLTTHSTHFIYGYMASDIWLRTILIVREETRCRHMGYSFRLTARVLLYAPSHRQDNTYHSLCYTTRGALAGTRNSSMGPPHEGSIRRPTAPWANALPLSYVPLPLNVGSQLWLHGGNKVKKEHWQDNTIYTFSIKLSFSSIGQDQ